MELQLIMARSYTEMGCYMSACQIYERLEMFEEVVECYAIANQKSKAYEFADKILESKPTPK